MNSKIKIQIILVALISLLFSACEEMLTPDPQNQEDRDRIINDPTWAEGLLMEGYNSLPSDYNFTSVATDDAVTNDLKSNYLRMASGELSALYNPMNKWNTYHTIFNLNYFLSLVDEVKWSWTSDDANLFFNHRFKGEAYGLRAYYFFELLKNHGGIAENGDLLGVPIVTNVLTINDNWALPRNSYQQCVDQIYSDIENALDYLPEEWKEYPNPDSLRVYGPQNKNRINASILKAFRSRVATFVSSPTFNGGQYDQEKCEQAAEFTGTLLKEAGGLQGIATEGHLFYDDNDDIDNPEIIWRTDWQNNNGREKDNFPPSLFGKGEINPSQNLVDVFPMQNGYPITDSKSGYDPNNPFVNRDPRLSDYIVYNGNTIGNDSIFSDINSELDGLNRTQQSTRTGYYMKKLLRSDVNLNPSKETTQRHFYTHIRYTELYLNYAEAANEAWGPDADQNGYGFTTRDIIAALRQRGGIDADDSYLSSITSKEQMRELIRNERRIELCFEGFRYWDMRRLELKLDDPARGVRIDLPDYAIFNVEDRMYEPFMIYGPIPQDEILKYDGLLQNKSY
ncbi:RagB/SusD family nutrient uptake outer membrane protein [uncultured Draconibacterium sp.]|uniref:RagB/SusD family nutrient uptake outer membrane protein n=1 Tax=uncultured Draconibacterium sp. TaxID=1573823 RepID=UPI0029C805A6|nr:RagB/SusD family nutrient uptake outer membrane protein [uncultured Draconibacterium sp.]